MYNILSIEILKFEFIIRFWGGGDYHPYHTTDYLFSALIMGKCEICSNLYGNNDFVTDTLYLHSLKMKYNL